MRSTGFFVGLIFSVALGSAACSRTADERDQAQEAAIAARDGAAGDEITVTGCLSGAADRAAFVVTADRNALTSGALHSRDGETPTYTYELVGNTADLSQHVGKQVQVTGSLDEDREEEAKVDDEAESKQPPVQSGDDKVTPAIETDTEMEIEVRRLTVSTVTPTGRACQTASGQ
jgi:hypothetical protein